MKAVILGGTKGIEWFASAWDLESQKFLKQFDLKKQGD